MTTRTFLMAVVIAAAGCTVKDTPVPPLAGPSELGLRITVQAVPDSILQDGFSQSSIQIEATGADGRPVRGLPLRVEILVNGTIQDFGTLSAKTIVTGDDGKARVIYTAPPRSADGTDPIRVVNVNVTPIGNDFTADIRRTVELRLVQPGVILPPNGAPVAQFTVTPQNPNVLQTAIFDASQSSDTDPVTGAPIPCVCTYAWDFGDGSTATGVFASHAYRSLGTFQVRLTVTDDRGLSSMAAGTITVGTGPLPTASFNFSPSQPAVNEPVQFNATNSTVQAPRRIVAYDWNFGNGRTGSGVTTTATYSAVGTYTVTLTVTDDAGNQATATQSITISATGALTANLIVSPSSGSPSTNFFFDASGSRPGPSPIVEYRFTFGDGTPDVVGSSPTTTHRYAAPGAYTARVTIRDSANRTATATAAASVQ